MTIEAGRSSSERLVAQLSPDARFLAYSLETKEGSSSTVVQSVIVTRSDGVQVDSISGTLHHAWNGMHFAWSPDGRRLAIVRTASDERVTTRDDSILIWNSLDRRVVGFQIGNHTWNAGWISNEVVLARGGLSSYELSIKTGAVTISKHVGPDLSHDRTYSVDALDDQGYLHVFDDSAGTEITCGVLQAARSPHVNGPARWIADSRVKGLLAVTACDSVKSKTGGSKLQCRVEFVDASTLERLSFVPGYLVGRSADGSAAVVVRNGALHFVVPAKPKVRSQASRNEIVRLSVAAQAWRSGAFGGDGHESLGTWQVAVRQGDRFGPGANLGEIGPNSFRVIRLNRGLLTVESQPGLAPPGVVVGPQNIGFWQRFLLSDTPLAIGTVSRDGGIVIRLQQQP